MIVVDTNVVAARSLRGVQTDLAEQVERIDPVWVVPPLWRYEFQNILAKAIGARQMTPGDAVEVWREVVARMADNEHEAAADRVIEISARHGITAYDANFIALATEMGISCITEDRELLAKFPGKALSMNEFMRLGRAGGHVGEARAVYDARPPTRQRRQSGSR